MPCITTNPYFLKLIKDRVKSKGNWRLSSWGTPGLLVELSWNDDPFFAQVCTLLSKKKTTTTTAGQKNRKNLKCSPCSYVYIHIDMTNKLAKVFLILWLSKLLPKAIDSQSKNKTLNFLFLFVSQTAEHWNRNQGTTLPSKMADH